MNSKALESVIDSGSVDLKALIAAILRIYGAVPQGNLGRMPFKLKLLRLS